MSFSTFAGSDTLISGIPEYALVEIGPQTPQGTKIYSYNMFLNTTDGSPFTEFDENDLIDWFIYYGSTYHGEDPQSYVYWADIYHYYEPQFGIKVPGMEISAYINLTGLIEDISPVSDKEIEQCSWGNSTFIKVPVDVYLLSPYIYHLGTSFIVSRISVETSSQFTYRFNRLAVETNAGEKFMPIHSVCNCVLQ